MLSEYSRRQGARHTARTKRLCFMLPACRLLNSKSLPSLHKASRSPPQALQALAYFKDTKASNFLQPSAHVTEVTRISSLRQMVFVKSGRRFETYQEPLTKSCPTVRKGTRVCPTSIARAEGEPEACPHRMLDLVGFLPDDGACSWGGHDRWGNACHLLQRHRW